MPVGCLLGFEQDLEKRWSLHAIEPLPGTKEKGPDKEDPIKFKCDFLGSVSVFSCTNVEPQPAARSSQ